MSQPHVRSRWAGRLGSALARDDLPGRPGLPEVVELRTLVLPAVLLVPVVLVQRTWLSGGPADWWAAPDLVVVAVLALAHHRGALAGGLVGFWAGLLLDLVPPAAGPLGAWALVLGGVGAAHGHVVATRRPGPILAMSLLALAATGTALLHAVLLWFAGQAPPASAVLPAVTGAGLWAFALAPLALVLAGGRRRTTDDHDPFRTVPAALEVPGGGSARSARPDPLGPRGTHAAAPSARPGEGVA